MDTTQKYRSDSIGLLIGALSKAQGSYNPLIANEDGPRGKFANLEATIDAVRESLAKNSLSLYQHEELLDEGMGAVLLKTIIAHESDQYISSWARIIPGNTLRETGNITEIIKRRQAQTLLGIAPSKYDPAAYDDDGADAAEKQLIKEVRKPREDTKINIDRTDVISKDQYDELMIELDGHEAIAKDIMDVYNLSTIADLPRSEYHKSRAKILKIKRVQDEYERRSR